MQTAPDRALSLASQLPPRSLQPVGAGMPEQAPYGTGPHRWQASSHPDFCSLSVEACLRKHPVGAGLPAMASGPSLPASRASRSHIGLRWRSEQPHSPTDGSLAMMPDEALRLTRAVALMSVATLMIGLGFVIYVLQMPSTWPIGRTFPVLVVLWITNLVSMLLNAFYWFIRRTPTGLLAMLGLQLVIMLVGLIWMI